MIRATVLAMLAVVMLVGGSALFAPSAAAAGPPVDPVSIQSGCSVPPCGDIYNHTNAWFNIKRQDCDGCGWIFLSIGPGQHKGGYWHDGIDWDAFGVPYRCSVNTTISGIPQVFDNNSTSPERWISFGSNLTVHLNSYSCRGA